jgi:polysaccharide export outer membrane protein
MKHTRLLTILIILLALSLTTSFAQSRAGEQRAGQPAASQPSPGQTGSEEINNLNQALAKRAAARIDSSSFGSDYVIGPNDLVEIAVFDIKDLDRVVRVSNQGRISLPLIGSLQASGLTARELEVVIAELLRQKYVKNPQVSVFIKEFQSRPVAIYGAVKKPGIVQLQSPRTLIEMLAMAEGFTDDAGDYVTVRRHAASGNDVPTLSDKALGGMEEDSGNGSAPGTGSTTEKQTKTPSDPPSTSTASSEQLDIIKVRISDLINSSDPKYNLMIQPGDAINVAKAGIVYVTGDVGRPGGFVLKERESLTVLQAVSLAEGVRSTAAKKAARIIRKHPDGTKEDLPINLAKVFEGKAPDVTMQANDILFVPSSASKSALRRGAEAVLQVGTGVAIYRR